MTEATTPAAVPIWEDFLEIFYSPRTVFERRKNSGFMVPYLVLVIVGIGLFFLGRHLLQPVFDAEMDRGMALAMKKNPQFTPEMAEKSKAFMQGVGVAIFPIIVLLVPFLVGISLWLFGKILEARQELSAACLVAVYSQFPRLLEGLVNLLQAGVLPAERLTSHYALQLGPARFLDPDTQGVLISVLGRLDVITLWCTVLLAIGLSVTGKIALKKAAIAAGLVWLLPTLYVVWSAVRVAQ